MAGVIVVDAGRSQSTCLCLKYKTSKSGDKGGVVMLDKVTRWASKITHINRSDERTTSEKKRANKMTKFCEVGERKTRGK